PTSVCRSARGETAAGRAAASSNGSWTVAGRVGGAQVRTVIAPVASRGLELVSNVQAPVLAALHASSFPPGERWGEDAMALQLGLPGPSGRLATAGGMILARMAADEAEILTLAVAPEARRQGCGLALLRAAEAHARAAGARAMFLEVSTSNTPALAL